MREEIKVSKEDKLELSKWRWRNTKTGIEIFKIMTQEEKDAAIVTIKTFRRDFDAKLQELKAFKDSLGRCDAAAQCTISMRALEDVNLRLGLTLKELGTENPYPNSKDPSNTIVDPTADGLKF